MKRGGPLKRKSRLRAKPQVEGQRFWTALRAKVWALSKGRCYTCAARLSENKFAAAHLHGLGRGRSRYDEDCRCSVCERLLNTTENVVATCFVGACNDLAAERWREEVGCRRPGATE